jgi:hypothetical protein
LGINEMPSVTPVKTPILPVSSAGKAGLAHIKRKPRNWRVDLIGRNGRKIAFGAVLIPRRCPAASVEAVAVAVYSRRHPGWSWEAIAI